MTARVLGVDPGFANLGWGVVEYDGPKEKLIAMGVLRTEPAEKRRKVLASDDNVRRARLLSRHIAAILYDHKVRAICAESMSFPRNSSASSKVGISWGILSTLAETLAMPIVQASPKEIKKTVAKSGGASKIEVEKAVLCRFLECKKLAADFPKTMREHAFDAVAAIVACADSDVIRAVRGAA